MPKAEEAEHKTGTITDLDALVRLWMPLAILRMSENRRLCGRTRFQKLVFLAEVEGRIGDKYGFCSHKFGPYLSDLQTMIEVFRAQGFVTETPCDIGEGFHPRYDYELTNAGLQFLKQIEKRKSIKAHWAQLRDALDEHISKDTWEIINHVYKNHYITDCDTLEDSKEAVIEQAKKYHELWGDFEVEHFPTSVYVQAALEQILEALGQFAKLEDDLDKTRLIGAAIELIRCSKDLFSQVEKYGCGEREAISPQVSVAMVEFDESLHSFEDFASKKRVLTPLNDQVIGDHLSDEEYEIMKEEMRKPIDI